VGSVVCISDHLAIPQLAGKVRLFAIIIINNNGHVEKMMTVLFNVPKVYLSSLQLLYQQQQQIIIIIIIIKHQNPLIGPNDDELGPRFPATSNAYPNSLRKCAFKAAQELKYKFVIPHGTYCFVSGPMYESRAGTFVLNACVDVCVCISFSKSISKLPRSPQLHHGFFLRFFFFLTI